MMLDRILDAIAGAGGGALSLGQLSAAVGVEIEALSPMLDLLVRRGLLSDSALSRSMACGGGCGVACDPGSCAFVVAAPRTLTIGSPGAPSGQSTSAANASATFSQAGSAGSINS